MDVMTPERTDELASLIGDMGTCASSSAEPLRSELAGLGRFAEPALTHVASARLTPFQRAQVVTLIVQMRKDAR
jgi:hypothetical protein